MSHDQCNSGCLDWDLVVASLNSKEVLHRYLRYLGTVLYSSQGDGLKPVVTCIGCVELEAVSH